MQTKNCPNPNLDAVRDHPVGEDKKKKKKKKGRKSLEQGGGQIRKVVSVKIISETKMPASPTAGSAPKKKVRQK